MDVAPDEDAEDWDLPVHAVTPNSPGRLDVIVGLSRGALLKAESSALSSDRPQCRPIEKYVFKRKLFS